MSNFGFTELRLVMPYDAAFREAKSAVKSRYILEQATVFETTAEAVADCSLVVGTTALGHRDLHVPLYSLETGGRLVREFGTSGRTALLFGSEKFGLSNDDLSFCHWLMRIPSREEHGSMNLGQAVAICLYELRRDPAKAEQAAYPKPDAADTARLHRLETVLLALLQQSGYSQERTAESTEWKLRRLIRRLEISNRDADVFLGMLRQILWRVEHPASNESPE